MKALPKFAEPASEVIERLAEPAPALLLLRYLDAKLPTYIMGQLGGLPSQPRRHLLYYRVDVEETAPGSASAIAAECLKLAGTAPPPILLLVPEYSSGGELPAQQATRFWKHLNALRETIGQLNARILICLDFVQEPYAAAHARDLLSWCAPKFTVLERLMTEEESTAMPFMESMAKASAEGATDEARFQARSLAPLWQDLLDSGRKPSVAEVEHLGLPLLDFALEEHQIAEAERLDSVIEQANLPACSVRGSWLRLRGDLAVALGQFAQADTAYHEAIRLQELLLQQSPKSLRAKRDLSVTLNQFATYLMERGQPGDAEQILPLLERNLRLLEQILAVNPQSVQALRDVSVSLEKLADFLMQRGWIGDADAALEHYQRCHNLREQLLNEHPQSAQFARDVSVSHFKLADFLARRDQEGDAEAGLSHCQRSLEVAESLLESNPKSARAARDLAVSFAKLADFLVRRGQSGDAEKAFRYYQRCQEVLESLLEGNPQSTQAARDVSVSLLKLADFLGQRGQAGDTEAALALYARDLEISEYLLKANPQSAQTARDVSVSLDRAGDFQARRGQSGDAEAALAYYRRSYDVRQQILQANPQSAQAVRDLSVSLIKLADFLAQRGEAGDREAALAYYQRCLELRKGLLDANPRSVDAARDIAVLYFKFAHFYRELGDEQAALKNLAKCFDVIDSFVREGYPMDAQIRQLHAELAAMFSKTSPD